MWLTPARKSLAGLVFLLSSQACSGTEPTGAGTDFVVSVAGETFVMRVADPETIRLARENLGRPSYVEAHPAEYP